ncbi:hypothetical protein ACFX15_037947 [Malus domestica]
MKRSKHFHEEQESRTSNFHLGFTANFDWGFELEQIGLQPPDLISQFLNHLVRAQIDLQILLDELEEWGHIRIRCHTFLAFELYNALQDRNLIVLAPKLLPFFFNSSSSPPTFLFLEFFQLRKRVGLS